MDNQATRKATPGAGVQAPLAAPLDVLYTTLRLMDPDYRGMSASRIGNRPLWVTTKAAVIHERDLEKHGYTRRDRASHVVEVRGTWG